MKKFIITMSMIGWLIGRVCANEITIYGAGNDTCMKMMVTTQQQENIYIYQAWIGGYLSALDIPHPNELTINGPWVFLQNMCKDYPKMTLNAMMREYMKGYYILSGVKHGS